MWLPRESTTTPSRRSISARFCPYGPTSAEAARLSSKSMTTCVSGGICMSRSSLRLGASEGESDALFGKGSGSRCHFGGRHFRRRHVRSSLRGSRIRRAHELAEQAIALEALNLHRQYLSDDVGRGHHMRRLQIGGAADNLAGIAGAPLE